MFVRNNLYSNMGVSQNKTLKNVRQCKSRYDSSKPHSKLVIPTKVFKQWLLVTYNYVLLRYICNGYIDRWKANVSTDSEEEVDLLETKGIFKKTIE